MRQRDKKMSEQELTTINLKRATLERLKSHCSRAITYGEFLNQCLYLFEKQAVKTND